MKTTNLAVSLLSLSLMVPGFTALLSGTAEAQTNWNVACPRKFKPYAMKEGDELRFIAQRNTGLQNNWTVIIKPTIRGYFHFSPEEAKNLTVGDVVCIPQNWR